jgi:hypothetical protein
MEDDITYEISSSSLRIELFAGFGPHHFVCLSISIIFLEKMMAILLERIDDFVLILLGFIFAI